MGKPLAQRNPALAAKLNAQFGKTSDYIPIVVLHKIITKRIETPGRQVTLTSKKPIERRAYGGIIHAKNGILQTPMPDLSVDFVQMLQKYRLSKDGIVSIDFVLYDETREHFTSLKVFINSDNKITIADVDSHPLNEDQQKGSDHLTLQKAICDAVVKLYPGYQIESQYIAAPKQQSENNCADFVLGNLLKRHVVDGDKKYADLCGDDEGKKRNALVQMIGDVFTDEEIQLLVTPDQDEAPAAVTETSPNKASPTCPRETTIFEKYQAMCKSWNRDHKGETIDIAADSDGKPRIILRSDSSTVLLNVATINPMTNETSSEEVSLTRTQGSDGFAHRSCRTNLPWEKQCEIFAAQAAQEYGSNANVTINTITYPGKAEDDKSVVKLIDKDQNTPALSKQEKALLVAYLKFAESVTYQGKQYNAKDNNQLLQKSTVADAQGPAKPMNPANIPQSTFGASSKTPAPAPADDLASTLVKGP